MAERRRWSARAVAGTAVLLAVVAACVRLGFWQLDRLQQRRALNAHVAARLQAPALPGAGALADTAGSLFRHLELSGRYDHPRSIVIPGRSLQGVPGVHLLTPLVVGPHEAVLVNRGWVPAADGATIPLDSFPVLPLGGQEVRVSGLLLPLPVSSRPAAAAGAGDSGFRRVWYHLNQRALQAQFPYHLAAAQLQLLPAAGETGFPTRLPPPELNEGPHLSYAIQWFSFALIGIIGWFALVFRSRRGGEAVGAELLAERPPADRQPLADLRRRP